MIIDWVDQKLLAGANNINKALNWLTGKDQFALAYTFYTFLTVYLCLSIGGIILTIWHTYKLEAIYCAMCLLVQFGFYKIIKNEVRKIQKEKQDQQSEDMKTLDLGLYLKKTRLLFIFISIFLCLLIIFIDSFISVDQSIKMMITKIIFLSANIPTIGALICYYLLSLDLPPYQKSQLLNLIRSYRL